MTVRWLPMLTLALAGCPPSDPIVGNGEVLDGSPTGAAAHGDDGAAPNGVIVRAVNDLGAAVGGGTVTLNVGGVEREVAVDAYGYGTLTLPEPGSFSVDGTGDAELHATHTAWEGPALARAERGFGTPGHLQPSRSGALAAIGTQAVWTGPGLPTHPVLTLDVNIDGISTLQIDGDGVPDALVWGGEVVVLLKGRPEGGFGWGAGIRAAGWSAEAAGMGDLDDDGDSDLVVGWTGPAGDIIQFWHGDGLWGLEPTHERTLNGPPVDLTVGRDAYNEATVATVLTDGVAWQRFVETSEGGYLVSGPTLDVGATRGWRVFGAADVNGNGIDDLVVMPPRVASAGRTVSIWDVAGSQPQHLDVTESGAHFALADANGDGLRNVWMLEDTERALRILTWDETRYLVRDAGTLPHFGPISAADVDGDNIRDLLIAGDDWAWHPGALDTADDDRWGVAPATYDLFTFDLVGPVASVDTGAGAAELVGVTTGGEGTRLTHWVVSDAGPVVAEHVAIDPAGGVGIDLAVCGDRAWALLNGVLAEVDVETATVAATRAVATPRAVSCGAGPGGSIAALLDGDDLILLGANLTEVEVVPGTDVVDVALVDRGSGAEAVACDRPCAAWNWRDDGPGAVLAWDEDATTLDGEVWLPGAEDVTVQDVDGDGRPDVLLRAGGGFVGVVRTTGDGIAPARWWHTDPAWTGAPVAASSPSHPGAIWLRRDDLIVRTE